MGKEDLFHLKYFQPLAASSGEAGICIACMDILLEEAGDCGEGSEPQGMLALALQNQMSDVSLCEGYIYKLMLHGEEV